MQAYEDRYCPVKLPGCIAGSPALHRWRGIAGLRAMRAAVGDAEVQAMHSPSSTFHGDILRHSPVTCTMASFLDAAILQARGEADPPNLYLAQQSLLEGDLIPLMQDVGTPEVLRHKQLSEANLWMSVRASRWDPARVQLLLPRLLRLLLLLLPPLPLLLLPPPPPPLLLLLLPLPMVPQPVHALLGPH
jgi:hypothetical protein